MLPSTKEVGVFSIGGVKLKGCYPDSYSTIDRTDEVANYWKWGARVKSLLEQATC